MTKVIWSDPATAGLRDSARREPQGRTIHFNLFSRKAVYRAIAAATAGQAAKSFILDKKPFTSLRLWVFA